MRTKRKPLALLLVLVLIMACIPAYAATNFTDVPDNAVYANSVRLLKSLGAVSDNEQGVFNPNDILTREQFAKIMVIAGGLEDAALSMQNTSMFSDIPANTASAGYINTAVTNNFITGKLDGKFHPTDPVTYSQITTILVRKLGYTTPADVPGDFPWNYLTKASKIGLTDDISLGSDTGVPRWAAALMIERFLTTNMNPAVSPTPTAFVQTTGYYTYSIILGNADTNETLLDNQVITENGIYANVTGKILLPGNKYILAIKNGDIIKASEPVGTMKNIPVDLVLGSKVSYYVGGKSESFVLPEALTYYYKGTKLEYAKVAEVLQKNSSIVLKYNKTGSSYEYAAIFDPIYSKPEVARNFVPAIGRLGSITFADGAEFVKDGEEIDISQIVERDIVYSVSDIWRNSPYYLVMDNKIGGEVTAVMPTRQSPKVLQVSGVDYQFSTDMDPVKVSNSNFAFTTGNNVIIYLGRDGKIVNVEQFGSEDNSGYAVVLSTSAGYETKADGSRFRVFHAKLLTADGVIGTYEISEDANQHKGKLVTWEYDDTEDIMSLEAIKYNFPSDVKIVKDDRLLGNAYVADNVKIFNIIYDDSNQETKAELIDWKDMPGGSLQGNKIWFTNTAGAFGDINVILTNDINEQREKTGIIKAVVPAGSAGRSYQYTVLIGNQEYTYTGYIDNAAIGSLYKFKMGTDGISEMVSGRTPAVKSTSVNGIDSRRIKLGDQIMYFGKTISVYFKDVNGDITAKTLADIDTKKTYTEVGLYINGTTYKVEAIYVIE